MLAGILIIALSSALLVYWFRYSCILILRNRSEIAEYQILFGTAGSVLPQFESGCNLSLLSTPYKHPSNAITRF